MNAQEDKVKLLQSLPIFESTPEWVLSEMANALIVLEFDEFHQFIKKGDIGNCMYVVADGVVKVHDDIHTLIELGPGDLIGELAILDFEPRSASVTTLDKTTLYQLFQDDFYKIIGNRPEILQGIIRMIVQRMRTQNQRIVNELHQRKNELQREVDNRTHDLRAANAQLTLQNTQLEEANTSIKIQKSELESAYEELNSILEQLNSRNLEITEQRNLLEEKNNSLNESLKIIEEQKDAIARSERMATLGMIAPVVAHEINTPLGVVNAGIQNISAMIPIIIKRLPESNDNLPLELHPLYWTVLGKALIDTPTLSGREERAMLANIEELFVNANIPEAETFAEKLVKIGIIDDFAPFLELLKALDNNFDKAREVIDVTYQVGMMRKQIKMMRQSVEKAHRIIKTLNTYVHKGSDNDAAVPVDVVETIDIVVTLYEYYFRSNIELTQDYDENLPEVMGYPDQLSQVWTNILMNAQHAVKSQNSQPAKIHIAGRYVNNKVIISITDNGPGIPVEKQDSLFKRNYDGGALEKGLGLAICRNIIQEHKGAIRFVSVPGETTFTVELPAIKG